MLLRKIPTNITLLNCCFFHTSQYNGSLSSTLKKVISGTKKKRRIYSNEAVEPTSTTFTKDLFKKNNPENTRRISVLNKLFMTRISDLMSTGQYASQFAGYGIEINRVKVTPDYRGINVYWIANGSTTDIEHLLESQCGPLRHELSQLYLMGVVPRIKFIKDKEYARFMEVEQRLVDADFGEDHERTDVSLKLKSYLELQKPLDSNLKAKIMSLEQAEDIPDEEEIPPMPQNVLGLRHADIMNRIKQSLKKSQPSHRHENNINDPIVHPFNPDPIEFKSTKAQREAFNQFLHEREILRSKAKNMMKHYRPDWDYIEEESQMHKENQLDSIKFDEYDDNDYIDDYENNDSDQKLTS